MTVTRKTKSEKLVISSGNMNSLTWMGEINNHYQLLFFFCLFFLGEVSALLLNTY